MTNKQTDLRKQAEKKVSRLPVNIDTLSPEETRRTLHELQVHQIELEMQNEALRTTQMDLDAARARYFDLYDLAPVGYCTISEKGLILETNLTAATLLGMARGALVKQPISRFIHKEDQGICYLHHKKLFETGEPNACELRMLKKGGTAFWVRLEATAVQDAAGVPACRRTPPVEAFRHSQQKNVARARSTYSAPPSPWRARPTNWRVIHA